MKQPIIGITQPPARAYPLSNRNFLVHTAYLEAIRMAGGIPVSITSLPSDKIDHMEQCPVQGILFTGGGDIHPNNYGEELDHFILGIDNERDKIELAWFNLALSLKIPFLGICRGMQLVNVALGGSLYHDLLNDSLSFHEHDWTPARQYPAHPIQVSPESALADIGFSSGQAVNSLHHQGIHRLGEQLHATAWADDSLIEGVELAGHPFGLAVQWHSEWLVPQSSSRALFHAFVGACL